MANSDTKTGQLDGNDILFPAPGGDSRGLMNMT